MNDMEKQSRRLFGGAAVLALASAVVKVIGLVYKIPLMNILGAEGMGYFNSAYEIYLLFCIVATAGLPNALSIVISRIRADNKNEKQKRIRCAYSVAFFGFALIGAIGTLSMIFFSNGFSSIIGNSGAAPSINAISLSVLFVCLVSALRGYFQGYEDMKKTAMSQVVEAVVKLFSGLYLASVAKNQGMGAEECAAYAVFGVSVATALSFFYLFISKWIFDSKGRRREPRTREGVKRERQQTLINEKRDLRRELFSIAVPITIGACATGITRIMDTTLILRRLQSIGYSEDIANSMYGCFSTLAVPISNLPPSLISGVALSLIPLLASAVKQKNCDMQEKLVNNAFKLTFWLALPASLGVCAFSKQILSLIYSSQIESVEFTAPLLAALGGSILLSCIITTENAVLHAYGQVLCPIISTLVGSAVKGISGYILIGIPSVNIMGAPISTLLCNFTVIVINLLFILKYSNFAKDTVASFVKITTVSVVSILPSLMFYSYLSNRGFHQNAGTLIAVALCGAIYLVLSYLFGIFNLRELFPRKVNETEGG